MWRARLAGPPILLPLQVRAVLLPEAPQPPLLAEAVVHRLRPRGHAPRGFGESRGKLRSRNIGSEPRAQNCPKIAPKMSAARHGERQACNSTPTDSRKNPPTQTLLEKYSRRSDDFQTRLRTDKWPNSCLEQPPLRGSSRLDCRLAVGAESHRQIHRCCFRENVSIICGRSALFGRGFACSALAMSRSTYFRNYLWRYFAPGARNLIAKEGSSHLHSRRRAR